MNPQERCRLGFGRGSALNYMVNGHQMPIPHPGGQDFAGTSAALPTPLLSPTPQPVVKACTDIAVATHSLLADPGTIQVK